MGDQDVNFFMRVLKIVSLDGCAIHNKQREKYIFGEMFKESLALTDNSSLLTMQIGGFLLT